MAHRPQAQDRDSERTSFSGWLDGIVPALYPSDAALARKVGVRHSTVLRWRAGSVPKVPSLVRLADATGTSLETLLRVAGYQPGGREGGKP